MPAPPAVLCRPLARRSRVAAALALATWGMAAVACGDASAPGGALGQVRTEVRILPGRAAPGEAVTLLAISTNAGRDTVEAGAGCGAGLGFAVTPPQGAASDPSAGPSICPLFDSNLLEPGETDTVAFRWTAPAALGTYRVRAGVRSGAGLRAVSDADSLVVRATPCPAAAASTGVDGAPAFVLADSAAVPDTAARRRLAGLAALRWMSGVQAVRLAAAPESLFTVGRLVAFEVAPGRRLVFEGDRVLTGSPGSLSWRGQLRGGRQGEASVLVAPTYGFGAQLVVLGPGGAVYAVQPVGGAWFAVGCVEQAVRPVD